MYLTNTSENSATLLKELNTTVVLKYVPVLVFIALTVILGLIGNSFTFIFYVFKNKENHSRCLNFSFGNRGFTNLFGLFGNLVELIFIVNF